MGERPWEPRRPFVGLQSRRRPRHNHVIGGQAQEKKDKKAASAVERRSSTAPVCCGTLWDPGIRTTEGMRQL